MYCGGNPIRYVDPSGCIKNSDNEDLIALTQSYTNEYNAAAHELAALETNLRVISSYAAIPYQKQLIDNSLNRKEELLHKMSTAEKNADAVRVTYYNLHNMPLPSDIKYREQEILAPDITQELNEEMSSFANDYSNVRYSMNSKDRLELFINLVKTGGRVDVKNSIFSYSSYYVYNKELYRKDDIGNIFFGYAGGVFGYNLNFLRFGAGIYQIRSGTSSLRYMKTYGDDPRDAKMIGVGFDIYSSVK